MHIDLSPLVNQVVVPILSSVLIAVATWVLTRVGAYFHMTVQNSQRAVVAQAIQNGLAYASAKLAPYETVSTSAQVGLAVGYILPKVPAALKSLGVTPDHLTDIVTAELQRLAPIAAGDPAAPPKAPAVPQPQPGT